MRRRSSVSIFFGKVFYRCDDRRKEAPRPKNKAVLFLFDNNPMPCNINYKDDKDGNQKEEKSHCPTISPNL